VGEEKREKFKVRVHPNTRGDKQRCRLHAGTVSFDQWVPSDTRHEHEITGVTWGCKGMRRGKEKHLPTLRILQDKRGRKEKRFDGTCSTNEEGGQIEKSRTDGRRAGHRAHCKQNGKTQNRPTRELQDSGRGNRIGQTLRN